MMAEKQIRAAAFWKRLTSRERLIISLTILTILSWLMYQFPYSLQVRSVNSLKARAIAMQKEIGGLTAQIVDLKRGESDTRKINPGWELADQRSMVLFLEDMSGEASRVGVNLEAVHPAQEVDKQSYKEVSMHLDLRGRYRELAEYFKRLESLPKVVNLRKIRLETCPDSSSVCSAHVEAVTYMTK